MKQQYKLTGFARLVIFLIFFLPIAYFGTKIYQGDMTFGDIQNYVEDKLESKSSPSNEAETYTPETNTGDCETMLKAKEREIQLLKRRIATLEK